MADGVKDYLYDTVIGKLKTTLSTTNVKVIELYEQDQTLPFAMLEFLRHSYKNVDSADYLPVQKKGRTQFVIYVSYKSSQDLQRQGLKRNIGFDIEESLDDFIRSFDFKNATYEFEKEVSGHDIYKACIDNVFFTGALTESQDTKMSGSLVVEGFINWTQTDN